MRVAMIGSGYVGLVSGACFADFGHIVTCVDKDGGKIARLRRGESPIFEPGLPELVASNVAAGRLAYHLKKTINDKAAFFHNLEYYPSVESLGDYLVITDAGVRFTLTPRMFAEYRAEFRYDANPAPGASRSDLRHIIGVGWQF